MNYVKLNLGGKERTAKLGLGFMQNVLTSENIDLQMMFEKFEKDTLFFVPKLLFYSLAFNNEVSGEKVDFTLNTVFDWVDEIGILNEEIVNFTNAFANSIKVHFPQDEGKTTPQKKVAKK